MIGSHKALDSQCVLLSNGNWAVLFFSASCLPPHFPHSASHVAITNLGVLADIYIPKDIFKCLHNAQALNTEKSASSTLIFIYFIYFFNFWAALRIRALSWQDGHIQMRKGTVYIEPVHFLTFMWWLCAGEAFIMGEE